MTSAENPRRAGIELFSGDDARPLMETSVMSMPTLDPPADEQLVEWAGSAGHVVKVLFEQEADNGMSLVWSWFGPGYVLPRHSHSADCLYYVLKGEAKLGRRTVSAGSGFFVPKGAPYAYAVGPEGVEVLEFRGVSSFDMKITESLPRWDHILSVVRANDEGWKAARIGF
jgi:quercetin dioxygenase-like cupin family protein